MTTPPPPPGGTQGPDDPYAAPYQPPQPPASEGYPAQPHPGEYQPPRHGDYAPPPPPPPPPPEPAVYPPEPEYPPYRAPEPSTGSYQQQPPASYGPSASTYGTGSGDYPSQTPPQSGAYGTSSYGEPYTPPPPTGGGGGGSAGGGYWPPGTGGGYGPSDPYDPIVPTDFNTWMNRVQGVFKRSWKSIGMIMLVGAVIPSIALGTTVNTSVGPIGRDANDNWDWGAYVGGGLWGLLAWVITGFLAAAAVVGAIRAAVREGTPGVQVPFGESMSYGFGRALPMWGWTILASIAISIGLCACFLPGVYLAIALSVLAPAFVFEGGNPFVRSFKLTHADFGRALSRVLVIFVAALVYGCVIGIPVGLIEGAIIGNDGTVGFGGFIGVLIIEIVRAVAMLPLAIFAVAGILVTYAELRGRQEGLSTQQMVSEADAIANK
ncbi:hypothetical protein Afil01_18460 [Actinorhabdospora filicis]|uniref:Glycerophosphoryl diester phosphodiesterase membrane domain-containing protein n=1 Tax=Actinorhabdospora filicis TaxID=1785913 RepID=A0A9W6SH43_9ACTN|nr:hypothetical protein [Actinorhabdospora filicis]GLZ77039.1 hypothetical protein Afil01_18460 [Actinorhabdospora filicis]